METSSTTQQSNGTETKTAPESKDVVTSRLMIENLHKLVSVAELQNEFSKFLQSINSPLSIKRAFIICYGPKSTGKGWIEIEGTTEATLDAAQKFNGWSIRNQQVSASLPNYNAQQRKLKRDYKRKKAKAPLPYQEELQQVQQKYPEGFKYISEEPPVKIEVAFKPSDPDFPYDIDKVICNITIPEDYPNEPCEISVMNEDIPPKIKTKISQAVAKRASVAYKSKPMLLGLLRWLDNNLENLLVDKVMTEDYQLKQAGVEIIPASQLSSKLSSSKPKEEDKKEAKQEEKKEEKSAPSQMSWIEYQLSLMKQNQPQSDEASAEGGEQHEDGEGESESDSDGEEGEDASSPAAATSASNTLSVTTAHKGTQIKAEGLKMSGIGIAECTLFRFVIQCTRCRKQIELTLDSSTYAVECENCHQAHIVTLRKNQMHEASDVLGYLDIEGCVPFDALEANFECSCFECSAKFLFKKITFTGTEFTTNCNECHSKASISIPRIKFIKIKAARPPPKDLDVIIKKSRKPKDPRLVGIRVGTPLPDHGTCKHYKRSKRWFRFPCCQRVYPCDICHDENSDGHEQLRANRMLCGECSKEQPFGSVCTGCGYAFDGAQTKFWEGGKGMRDPARLSKKDPHKYKGIGKTQSQKSKRVGGSK